MNDTCDLNAELAIADLFATLGAAFLEPSPALLVRLRGLADEADALPADFAEPTRHLAAAAEAQGLEALQEAFVSRFGHVAMSDAPAYETLYAGAEVFAQAATLADVSGFFRAFGVEPSKSLHEAPDHVALELEFAGLLVLRAAAAPTYETRETTLAACRAFLNEHLGRWAPLFFARLQRGGGFLGEAAALADRLLAFQCERVGASPVRLSAAGGFSAPLSTIRRADES